MVMLGKKGQVTIFIILAIVLVAGIVLYFVFNGDSASNIPKDLQKGEDAYKSCIMERAKLGISLLGQQGGYIYLDELQFYPGSPYMPSSSQLNFYGNSVPYWLFVSGNNIVREQKPTKEKMTSDLRRFIEEGLNSCNFDSLNANGIYVDVYNGSVDVKINDNSVDAVLSNSIFIRSEEDNQSATVSSHKISVSSKLGKFYNLATKVYDKEKSDAFLEAYGLDVMQLYAPVTGVDFRCAPMIFNEAQVKGNITQGLEENIAALKVSGNYYDLSSPERSYFVVDVGQKVDENVNFIYSGAWPTKIEMFGDKVVQPVGNQQGLGMFGLCFVPYHFVYNINFPVLVQFYDNNEIFQFGIVAIIKNSQSRDAVLGETEVLSGEPICDNSNAKLGVSVYDLDLNPINANLRFSCLGQSCELGISEDTTSFNVPMCVNGVLDAYAEGYAPASVSVSTNRETSTSVLMKKIYDVNVSIGSSDKITVVFSSPDYSSVLNYPEEKSVKLVEGEYNITAFVYKNTSINFAGIKEKKCLDVPSSSIGGLFGSTEQRCYELDIPAQEIDSALVGGGKAFDYFAEEQLRDSASLKMVVPMFDTPQKIEDLENNYLEWEVSKVDLSFE
jgi:hypothetical protein